MSSFCTCKVQRSIDSVKPLAVDRVDNWSGWAGLLMFPGFPASARPGRQFESPPRAQCYRWSESFCRKGVHTLTRWKFRCRCGILCVPGSRHLCRALQTGWYGPLGTVAAQNFRRGSLVAGHPLSSGGNFSLRRSLAVQRHVGVGLFSTDEVGDPRDWLPFQTRANGTGLTGTLASDFRTVDR